jgi:hypothetical protein
MKLKYLSRPSDKLRGQRHQAVVCHARFTNTRRTIRLGRRFVWDRDDGGQCDDAGHGEKDAPPHRTVPRSGSQGITLRSASDHRTGSGGGNTGSSIPSNPGGLSRPAGLSTAWSIVLGAVRAAAPSVAPGAGNLLNEQREWLLIHRGSGEPVEGPEGRAARTMSSPASNSWSETWLSAIPRGSGIPGTRAQAGNGPMGWRPLLPALHRRADR